jgi:chromosome segregation ATPase
MTNQDLSQIKELFEKSNKNLVIKLEELKQDVAEIKQDVTGLKQDVAEIKQDVAEIKQDVVELKQSTDIRFDGVLEVIKFEVGDAIEKSQNEIIEKIEKNLNSNDKIATEIKDNRQEQMMIIGAHQRIDDTLFKHEDKIEDHNKRIIKIEKVVAIKIMSSV